MDNPSQYSSQAKMVFNYRKFLKTKNSRFFVERLQIFFPKQNFTKPKLKNMLLGMTNVNKYDIFGEFFMVDMTELSEYNFFIVMP